MGSEAIDLGGPRRQFFNIVFEGLAKNEVLRLFQGDLDKGHLLPTINHDAIICGQFKLAGRMILHSILNEGPASGADTGFYEGGFFYHSVCTCARKIFHRPRPLLVVTPTFNHIQCLIVLS